MKISRNLVELNDNYDFSEVYCMEKPFGIFMEGFGEGISNAFYMVLKFFQAYQVDGYEYNQINFESMYQVQKDILREFFNTEVVREQINGEEIVSWIEDKIREDCAPFVFVNLKEVFYSKYYKRYDWGHVLLIYGFNSKDRLFYVMDSTQLYKNEHLAIFRPFPITYEIVESAYRASLDVYPSEVCYISCAQKITELKEVICNVIDLGIKNIKDYILKEKIVLKKLMSCEEIDMIDDYAEQLLSIKNAKKVFFKEVLNFVHKIDGKAEIDKITNDIVKGWEKIAIKSVGAKYRGNKIDIDLDKLLESEKLVWSYLENVKNELFMSAVLEVENNDIRYENNIDNVIKKLDKAYVFAFSDKKVYPAYGVDDAPKVVLEKVILGKEKYFVKVDISNENSCECIDFGFMSGIIIRTENESSYYWGNCSNQSIRLDMSGICNNIFEISSSRDRITLYMRMMKENKVVVGYVEGKQMVDCYEFVTDSVISDISIGCKTWGCPEEVCFKFSNIYVKET